jgi:hypothetical protein
VLAAVAAWKHGPGWWARSASRAAGTTSPSPTARPSNSPARSWSVWGCHDRPRQDHGRLRHYINQTHSREKHTLAQMPARLVYLPIGDVGWCIELGPYTFDRDDIEVLREAIAGYDRARNTLPTYSKDDR